MTFDDIKRDYESRTSYSREIFFVADWADLHQVADLISRADGVLFEQMLQEGIVRIGIGHSRGVSKDLEPSTVDIDSVDLRARCTAVRVGNCLLVQLQAPTLSLERDPQFEIPEW